MKMLARFRCGAEAVATDSWRTERGCRSCGKSEEKMGHLIDCIGATKDVFKEDGKGVKEMRRILLARTE